MNIIEFAEKYLGEFKVTGKELKIKKCPFCNREKEKFYINTETGMFICHSGSCNESGSFIKLQHKFGIKVNFKESLENSVNKKTVLKLTLQEQNQFKKMSDEMYNWWLNRGISKETLNYMKVCSYKNEVVFPYLQENELKMIKYRDINIKQGEKKKIRIQENSVPVLWGIDKVDLNEPVIITEGEPDMLSWIEAGYKNVISIPLGTSNLKWIDNNLNYIEKIKTLYICFDNDEAGREALKKIKYRLGSFINLYVIDTGSYNDVNEMFVAEGKNKLIYSYEHAEEYLEMDYYYAENIDISTSTPETSSFIKTLDKQTGGFIFPEVIVWSAYTGCGKTTLLSQMALNNISLGNNVCYYTGEDSKEDILTKIALQLYGEEGTKEIYNKVTEQNERYATEDSRKKIKKDIGRKLIILESEIVLSNEELLLKMKKALIKDNCRVFIIDNLMQIDIIKKETESKNEQQKLFVRELVRFARQNNIQIHLVAHNKKPETSNQSGKTYDVSGASEIVNLAHMVIGIDRISKEKKQELLEKGIFADSIINVLKKRKRQGLGGFALLKFDNSYQMFYDDNFERIKINKNHYGFLGKEIDDEIPIF